MRIYHVMGHQDKKISTSDLPLPARINVICDDGCKEKAPVRISGSPGNVSKRTNADGGG